MGVIITFSFPAFTQMFPEFAPPRLSAVQATTYFNLATQFVRNDGNGPVPDTQTQTNLLYLATAHIAQLLGPSQPGGTTPGRDPSVVGAITNANEGSVSVAVKNDQPPGSAQWWNSTQYGAMCWLAMAPFRIARYLPGPVRPEDPFPPFGLGGWGPGSWSGGWPR